MIEPAWQDLHDADMPRAYPKEGVSVKVIAGEQFGAKSPVFTRTPSMMLDVHITAGTDVELTLPASFCAFVYVLAGSGTFGGNETKGEQRRALYLDDNCGEMLPVKADRDEELRFMLIAGEPLNVRIC
jgi:redox-sensitive bicupin YhaK (pirin superfamily)